MLTAWLGIYMFLTSVLLGEMGRTSGISLAAAGLIAMVTVKKGRKWLLLLGGGLFLLRIMFSVNFEEYRPGDRVRLTTQGRRVVKIDDRYPRRAVYTDMGEEGEKYIGVGTIGDVISDGNYTFYKMRTEEKDRIEEGFFRRSLRERTRDLTRGYSRGLRGFYEGVIGGEKEGIGRKIKDQFSYTGTSHLIVISGLHIGVIIALILYLAGKLPLGRSPRYFLTMGVLSVYAAAVWGSPSVIRAYIMGMCYLAAGLLYEETDIRKSYFAAMVINLFIDPLGGMSVSFQMSYMAVFSIIFIYPLVEERIRGLEKWQRLIAETATLSLIIQVMLTPIFIVYFRSIPLLSFLINIVAIPLGVVFVQTAFLALLLSFIGVGGVLMPTVNLLYIGVVGLIGASSRLPLLSLEYRGVSRGYMIPLIYLFMYMVSKKSLRGLGILPLAVILFMNTERYSPFEGRGIRYYPRDIRVIISDGKLRERDLDYLWNNKIKGGEVLISPQKQPEGILSKLKIKDDIIIGDDQEVIVDDMRFKNIDGKIVLVE